MKNACFLGNRGNDVVRERSARISESGKRERKFFVTESEAERYSKIHRVRIEKSRTEAARRSNAKKRDAAIEQTLSVLAACREVGIFDQMEYLDFGKTIAGHSPEVFARFTKNYLEVPPNFL